MDTVSGVKNEKFFSLSRAKYQSRDSTFVFKNRALRTNKSQTESGVLSSPPLNCAVRHAVFQENQIISQVRMQDASCLLNQVRDSSSQRNDCGDI